MGQRIFHEATQRNRFTQHWLKMSQLKCQTKGDLQKNSNLKFDKWIIKAN